MSGECSIKVLSFHLGLENSKVFIVISITGVLSISGVLAWCTFLRGNSDIWQHGDFLPKEFSGVSNKEKSDNNPVKKLSYDKEKELYLKKRSHQK